MLKSLGQQPGDFSRSTTRSIMPETHDTKRLLITKGPLILNLEPLFVHKMKYPPRRVAPVTPPLTEKALPRELEDPFRIGHGRVFRFPFTRRGFALGYWEPAGDPVLAEEEGHKLLAAVSGAHIPGITATEIREWQRPADVRRRIDAIREWILDKLDYLPGRTTTYTRVGDTLVPEDAMEVVEWQGLPPGYTQDHDEVEPVDLTDQIK